MNSAVDEAINLEKQQLQISREISDSVIDSQILKIITEAQNEETVH